MNQADSTQDSGSQDNGHQAGEPTLLNREQRRATHALSLWEGACRAPWPEANYRTLVNGFGAQVLRSGLLAAVAFARRYVDQKAAAHMLRGLFSTHVMSITGLEMKSPDGNAPKSVDPDRLLAELAKLDVAQYMLATREVLAAVLWMRRAVQEGGGSDDPTSPEVGATL